MLGRCSSSQGDLRLGRVRSGSLSTACRLGHAIPRWGREFRWVGAGYLSVTIAAASTGCSSLTCSAHRQSDLTSVGQSSYPGSPCDPTALGLSVPSARSGSGLGRRGRTQRDLLESASLKNRQHARPGAPGPACVHFVREVAEPECGHILDHAQKGTYTCIQYGKG